MLTQPLLSTTPSVTQRPLDWPAGTQRTGRSAVGPSGPLCPGSVWAMRRRTRRTLSELDDRQLPPTSGLQGGRHCSKGREAILAALRMGHLSSRRDRRRASRRFSTNE